MMRAFHDLSTQGEFTAAMKKHLRNLCLSVLLALLWGCAVPLSDAPCDPQSGVNISQIEDRLTGTDPLEGGNRVMFAVTDFCMDYIVDFIGRIYCSILPRPVIDAVDNFCLNLEYPGRAISCLLSAEWRGAGDETVRFLANSTIGIGGLFDVAGYWWGFHSTGSDFGQAFAAWGIAPGCTLTLPFTKSTNVRDTVGGLFDIAFDAKSYIPYMGYITTLNRLIVAHRDYIVVVEGSSDRYKSYRQVMAVYREMQKRKFVYHAKDELYAAAERARKDPPPPPEPELPEPAPAGLKGEWLPLLGFRGETALQQSMRSLRFRPQRDKDFWYYPLSIFNHDFVRSGSKRRIRLHENRPKARYCFWKQPEPEEGEPPREEKLAILLPGIGGTWDTSSCVALAELFYKDGYDVVAFDSAFSHHFVVSSGQHIRLPGFLPEDAYAVKELIASALDELRERGEIKSPYTVLAGYSMGAMHALKIASTENGKGRLKLDRVVAINPPVDLRYALEHADRFARRGSAWSIRDKADKLVTLSGRQYVAHETILPPQGAEGAPEDLRYYRFGAYPDEAECAVGLSLNMSLRDVLLVVHRERPIEGVETPFKLLDRNRLYLELDDISFKRYAEEILPREYPGATREELFAASSLVSLKETLENDRRIRVLHSWNDPLISAENARFLDAALGRRIVWCSAGGHLGNLCTQAAQERIIALAAPEPGERPADRVPAAAAAGAEKR